MVKMTVIEYMDEYYGTRDISDEPEWIGAKMFYVSENAECPYVGVEYENGELWIYGARKDHKCENIEEVMSYLEMEDKK